MTALEIWRTGEAGGWPRQPATFGARETFTLASISVSLSLDGVYAGTRFGPL